MSNYDRTGCFIVIVILAVVVAVSAGYTCLIANSSLPDWMKFWLLM